LTGGFLAELSVFVVVIPVLLLAGQCGLPYAALRGTLVGSFFFRYLVAHGLKIRGGATGDFVAAREQKPMSTATVDAR